MHRIDPPEVVPSGFRSRYSGVVAAAVTPFDNTGVIDECSMVGLCRRLATSGCDGIFVASSTGESMLLDEDDRRSLTVAAREGAGADALVYAGISGTGIKQAIRYATNAAQDGADAAVVMAPCFLRLDQVAVEKYLLAVAEASPIPMVLYHHPRMPTSLEPETVGRLMLHPNFVGIKETSLEIQRTRALIESVAGTRAVVLQGNESLVRDSLSLGADGMVTALAGVVPEWHAELYRACQGGDSQSADFWHNRICQLWSMFRFDLVAKSTIAFTTAIRLALRRRGWLVHIGGPIPGYTADKELVRLVEDHLNVVGISGDALEMEPGPAQRVDGTQKSRSKVSRVSSLGRTQNSVSDELGAGTV